MTTFVDSSAWYAAADRGDVDHERITEVLGDTDDALVTSDHVVVETWFLLDRRLSHDSAETFLAESVRGGLTLESILRADLERAADIGRAYADQSFSLVDRTSFAVMERLGIERVVSLDDDFAVYRYGPRRRRAFEVLR